MEAETFDSSFLCRERQLAGLRLERPQAELSRELNDVHNMRYHRRASTRAKAVSNSSD